MNDAAQRHTKNGHDAAHAHSLHQEKIYNNNKQGKVKFEMKLKFWKKGTSVIGIKQPSIRKRKLKHLFPFLNIGLKI